MRSLALQRSLLWVLIIALMVLILSFRLQLSFDLGAFLPREGGPNAEVLLQQLGSGPGSRLMVLGISGGAIEQREEASRNLQASLNELDDFVQVVNGEAGTGGETVPEPIRTHYPLMLDLDLSTTTLQQTVNQRLQDLALGGGGAIRQLLVADPYLASVTLLQNLSPGAASGELWQAKNGSRVLLAETRAAGTDLKAQANAMATIRNAFKEQSSTAGLQLEITGVGPFGVDLQKSIQAEATLRSILASAAVILVLLLLYRSFRLLMLVALPVVVGFLAGLTAVSLCFESVHGITLAFGFTLLGVAVDFPLHLFTHHQSRCTQKGMQGFWRTLWLGAGSTALAYMAMLFTGASGLAQLGVFSASGIGAAVLVTRYWLPALLPAADNSLESGGSTPQNLNFLLAGVILVLALAYLLIGRSEVIWDDRLSALSPVAEDRIALDGQLRSATAAFDMRYQIRLEATSQEQLLQQCEQLEGLLQDAQAKGWLSGWSAICQLLPSLQMQQQRLARIPAAAEMHARLETVLADSPFQPNAFQPFEQLLQATRDNFPLSPEDFAEGPLSAWLDAHLLQTGDRWYALVNLAEPQADELAALIQPLGPAARWVDLHQASEQMMRSFRIEASRAVALAALAILLVLAVARTRPRRLLWILLNSSACLAFTVAVIMAWQGALNMVHLVALLLVLGLGLDYSLFLSREDSSADYRSARYSILACALSTTLAFAVLAGSSIPMLRYIGLTVAAGSISAFLLAMAGSRKSSAKR